LFQSVPIGSNIFDVMIGLVDWKIETDQYFHFVLW